MGKVDSRFVWWDWRTDFAGGTVVHISSGVSALVAAIVIGPRRSYPSPTASQRTFYFARRWLAVVWLVRLTPGVHWLGGLATVALLPPIPLLLRRP